MRPSRTARRSPTPPDQWADPGPGFLKALDDAARSTARNNPRYALEKLQLRGKAGAVAATDGRQLLVQGGFSLPWPEDLLVPVPGAFGCRELPPEESITLGRTATHVCLRVGPWIFHLAIDTDGRYPNVDAVFPARTGKVTVCRLARADADFLARALPRLPGQDEEDAPVTLDLGETVAVRARAEGQSRPTEVVLSASEAAGPPVRCCVHRQHLARALELGFAEMRVVSADAPVVCEDGPRKFAWMTLEKGGAVAPSADALRLVAQGEAPVARRAEARNGTSSRKEPVLSQQDAAVQARADKPARERRKARMAAAAANGSAKGRGSRADDGPTPHDGPGGGGLMAEAQALKEALRDAYGRASRLVLALQRQLKLSKLLATTLTSLRQLQHLDA